MRASQSVAYGAALFLVLSMRYLTRKLTSATQAHDTLELPFDLRQKSRLRATLASGEEVGLFLERGSILRGGEFLQSEDGALIVRVLAAPEEVYDVTASNATELMRATYHLGNRHVPLQIGDGWIRLEQDAVLKEMLLGLGVSVTETKAPFEPEAGAYGGGHRHHEHVESTHLRPPARLRHG